MNLQSLVIVSPSKIYCIIIWGLEFALRMPPIWQYIKQEYWLAVHLNHAHRCVPWRAEHALTQDGMRWWDSRTSACTVICTWQGWMLWRFDKNERLILGVWCHIGLEVEYYKIYQSSEEAEGECFPFFEVFNDREFKYRNRMHLLLSNHD